MTFVLITSLLPLAAQVVPGQEIDQTASNQGNQNDQQQQQPPPRPAWYWPSLTGGFSLWDIGYSSAQSVTGGTYLRVSLDLFVSPRLLLTAAVATNILTNAFQDQLLAASLLVNPWIDDDASFLAFGLSWLTDFPYLSGAQFLGLTLVPVAAWTDSEFPGTLYLSFLPVTLYFDLTSGQTLWSLSFISWKYFFGRLR
ncbi:MAG: hypothetical protein A2004_04340 [Spirochaetes bacterium GWC1_61_12]|nr:MAG: hypothetical protein A2004_04340 [Spirochaetes bacterium GWC1_61_12]HAP42851.1 hypothetical protein [Spirochaetaceae bacterium]HAW86444.1 hypothetical protein [Spirochaetaceae bacterium]HAX38173.1 hypothetical protein [Spirochaetaceae bacterium]HBO40485.1 hypothetical protein [Spirochaetaceae bacterium]